MSMTEFYTTPLNKAMYLTKLIALRASKITYTLALSQEYAMLRQEQALTVFGALDDDWVHHQMRPEIIIAGLPIYSVQHLGHASSDEILKYRSMGGIFLAHQKGGKKTFKFTARMYGPYRYFWYKALEDLLYIGTEEKNPVNKLFEGGNLVTETIKDVQGDSPIIRYVKSDEISDQEYAYHHTYPIITQSRIYMNMYMETLVLNRDVKLGKNVIEVNCAFREYNAPIFYQRSDPTSSTYSYYTTYTPLKIMELNRSIENYLNLGWAVGNILQDLANQPDLRRLQKGEIDVEIAQLASIYLTEKLYRKAKNW